jgi:hypothetical protein
MMNIPLIVLGDHHTLLEGIRLTGADEAAEIGGEAGERLR